MDAAEAAPTVVAVVVTRNPGPWFEDTLASIAAQDYPGISILVLDDGSAEPVTARVAGIVPSAFVRREATPIGYGAAANLVLSMVQGATFYLFCHDDVALAPDAVEHLVSEAQRSVAGAVTPKLVSWDDHERMLAIGMGLDRTGRPLDLIEPFELDQGQHDAPRDVAFAPGAVLLVRATVFAAAGGFDPTLTSPSPVVRVKSEKARVNRDDARTSKDNNASATDSAVDTGQASQAGQVSATGTVETSAGVDKADGINKAPINKAPINKAPIDKAQINKALGTNNVDGEEKAGLGLEERARLLGPDLGEDVDLSWRLRQMGERIVAAPAARAAHVGTRHGALDPDTIAARRSALLLTERNRIRTMIATASGIRLPLIVPLLALQHLAAFLSPRRRGASASSLATWRAAFSGLRSMKLRRKENGARSTVSERDLLKGLSPATAVARQSLRSEVSADGALVWSAAGRAVAANDRPRRVMTAIGILCALILLIGSRGLLFRGIPVTGQFARIGNFSELWSEALSGWRSGRLGSSSPVAPGVFVLLGLVGILLGKAGLAGTVLILGSLPLGLVGMWRLVGMLVRNSSFDLDLESDPAYRPTALTAAEERARLVGQAAATFAYAVAPVFVDAINAARLDAVLAYGVLPWLLRAVLRVRRPGDSKVASVLRVGVPLALSIALAPTLLIAWVIVVVGWMLGVLIAPSRSSDLEQVANTQTDQGRIPLRALLRHIGFALLSAVILLLPWLLTVVFQHRETLVGGDQSRVRSMALNRLIHLAAGPVGRNRLGWLLVVAALVPLFLADGPRERNAVRAWSMSTVAIALTWLAGRGWGPLVPPVAVMVVIIAMGFSIAAGLGLAAFSLDVRNRSFGWRQGLVLASAVGLGLTSLPLIAAARGGRWNLPARTMANELAWMPADASNGSFRSLWIGSQRLLPGAGVLLGSNLAVATSTDGLTNYTDTIGTPSSAAMKEMVRQLQAGGSGATNRLGAALAPFGVRYIVLVQRAWKGGLRQRVDPAFAQHLFGQLDFRQIDVGGDVILLENTRWVPVRSLVPGKIVINTASFPEAAAQSGSLSGSLGGSLGGSAIAGASVALNGATALLPLAQVPDVGAAPAIATEIAGSTTVPSPRGPFMGSTNGEPTLAVGGTYDANWTMKAEGKTVRATELANGTMAFDIASIQPSTVSLRFNAGLAHWFSLLLQGILWAFSLTVLFRRRSRRSGSRQSQLLQVEAAAALAIEQSGPLSGVAADDDEYLDFSGNTLSADEGGGLARPRKVIPRAPRTLKAPSRAAAKSPDPTLPDPNLPDPTLPDPNLEPIDADQNPDDLSGSGLSVVTDVDPKGGELVVDDAESDGLNQADVNETEPKETQPKETEPNVSGDRIDSNGEDTAKRADGSSDSSRFFPGPDSGLGERG
jgi:GT2 family glycosyltransferase